MPSRPASFRHLAILQQAAEERALVNGLARECTQLRVPYMRAHVGSVLCVPLTDVARCIAIRVTRRRSNRNKLPDFTMSTRTGT